MSLFSAQQKRVAHGFATKWHSRGNEKEETQTFWLELLRDVIGMEDVTTAVRFEQRTVDGGYIDVVADAKTFIIQKSRGIPLDKAEIRQKRVVTPFQPAKAYADSMPNSQRPDTIIVCDFNEFRIHDLDTEKPSDHFTSFTLDELPDHLYLLDFLVDPQRARRAREEKVSIDAGALIGRLYKLLAAQYIDPEFEESQHALNVLCVRLVFFLFAEYAFFTYLSKFTADQVRGKTRKDSCAYIGNFSFTRREVLNSTTSKGQYAKVKYARLGNGSRMRLSGIIEPVNTQKPDYRTSNAEFITYSQKGHNHDDR